MATLETDGGVRVFARASTDWQLIAEVLSVSLVVEVKLERQVLVAVSHSEDGKGTVHVWKVCPKVLKLLDYCHRNFREPPDRVEVRHGGRFIEVQLLPDGIPVDGVYDIHWLEPFRLDSLMVLKRCIGDWRCDLRDSVAVLEKLGENLTLYWRYLWQPLLPDRSVRKKLPCPWFA